MKQTQNQNGFTLIEVLIAAVIITFGMLAMGSFLSNYVSMNALNERRTEATIYAQKKIEELRTRALQTTLTTATDTNLTGRALSSEGEDLGPTGTAGEIYTIFWRVNDATDPKQLLVLVSWDGTPTSTNNVTLSTLINNDA